MRIKQILMDNQQRLIMMIKQSHSPFITLRFVIFSVIFPLVIAGCDKSPEVKHQYPAMNTAAFNHFATRCSGCHAPPLPSKHTAKEWSMVVARMMKHQAERGVPPISMKGQKEILKYLQKYAAERI